MNPFTILLRIINLLLNASSPEDVVSEVLEDVGKFLDADRSYWFKITSVEGKFYATLAEEWVKNGISPQINNPDLKFFPHEIEGVYGAISKNAYFMSKVSSIKNDILRRNLLKQEIKSLLVVPIFIEGEYLGFIGVDRVLNDRLWNDRDIEFLRLVAYIFGLSLLRYRTELELNSIALHLDTLLNAFPDIIVIKDEEKKWLFANDFSLNFLGLSGVDYRGKTNEELAKFIKEEAIKKAFLRGEKTDEKIVKEGKFIKYISKYAFSDGRKFFFEVRKVPIYDGKKRLRGILSVARDVTEEKIMKRQVEEGERLKSLGRMAGNIAHDLNNILTAIMGSASILEKKAPDELKKYIESILRASDEAKNLANQMLSYAGSRMLEEEVFDLGEEARHVGEFIKTSVSKDTIFTIEISKDNLYVKGNRGQIQQIITNLVMNANDAASGKRVEITLKVFKEEIHSPLSPNFIVPSKFKDGEYAVIEVTDTGPGIPESVRAHLFEPFFSTKGIGRGLGLFSVFGIVKSYNGIIFLKTKEGMGTTFKIYLPLASSQSEKTPQDERVEAKNKKIKILIVDDEPYIRDVLKEMLLILGYEAFSAESGKKALEILDDYPDVELAIIDYSMPEMNGLELLKKIRALNSKIKVVFSSGYAKEDIKEVVTGEAITFLQKPYSMNNLKKAIDKLFPPE